MRAARAGLLVASALCVCSALFFARPPSTPGPAMRDFEAYYAAGALWLRGGDAYSAAIWGVERELDGVDAARYELLPFVSPPATLPFWSLFARLPFSAAEILWRALLVASALVLALAALRLAQVTLSLPAFIALATFSLGFGPLTSAMALGQIALPACAALVLTSALLQSGRREGAMVSFFAWAQPNIALALAAYGRFKTVTFHLAIAAAAFLAAGIAAAGIRSVQMYARVLSAHGHAERFSAIQLTPGAIAYGFGSNARTALAVELTVVALAFAAWIVLIQRLEDPVMRFCGTCALLPLAVPFFHEHDLIVTLAPALVLVLRANPQALPFAVLGTLFCATDWLGLAQRPDGAVQTLLLVAGAGLALAALRADRSLAILLVTVAAGAAIASAALFAHGHAVPIWPDAMLLLPDSVHGASAAAVWAAEQRSTGLFVPNAWASLLRCCSLLGCALLTVAVALGSKSSARSRTASPVPV